MGEKSRKLSSADRQRLEGMVAQKAGLLYAVRQRTVDFKPIPCKKAMAECAALSNSGS